MTDEGKIEGKTIDEDLRGVVISSIARTNCDPPVQFRHRLFEDVSYNGEEGDVLLVDIDPAHGTPRAVIQRNGQLREYYIRTGSESRPIQSGEEIEQLHSRTIDPDFSQDQEFISCFEKETLSNVSSTPDLPNQFEILMQDLTQEDIEYLSDDLNKIDDSGFGHIAKSADEHSRFAKFLAETFPYLLNWHISFWNPNSISVEDDYFEHIGVNNFELEHAGEVIENLSVSIEDVANMLADRAVISVPRDTEVILSYDEPEDSIGTPGLIFRKENLFKITIYLWIPKNGLIEGIPHEYPGYLDSNIEPEDILTFQPRFYVSGEFEYPDEEDPRITQHVKFKNELCDFLDFLGWEEYIEHCAKKPVYDIKNSIESIESIVGKD